MDQSQGEMSFPSEDPVIASPLEPFSSYDLSLNLSSPRLFFFSGPSPLCPQTGCFSGFFASSGISREGFRLFPPQKHSGSRRLLPPVNTFRSTLVEIWSSDLPISLAPSLGWLSRNHPKPQKKNHPPQPPPPPPPHRILLLSLSFGDIRTISPFFFSFLFVFREMGPESLPAPPDCPLSRGVLALLKL